MATNEPTKLDICRADRGLNAASLWVLRLSRRGFSTATAATGPAGGSVVASGANVAGLLRRGLIREANGIHRITPLGEGVLQRYEEVMR